MDLDSDPETTGVFPMEVIVLTTLFSVLFAILFLLFFLKMRENPHSCADQDALLPFRHDDLTVSQPNAVPVPERASEDLQKDHNE